MRAVISQLLFIVLCPLSSFCQPFERADEFFERDYLTKPRVPDGEETPAQDSSALRVDSFEAPQDSWEAPKTELQGQSVAGSDRVREYRDRKPTPQVEPGKIDMLPGAYRAVPLGGGAALILPGGRGE